MVNELSSGSFKMGYSIPLKPEDGHLNFDWPYAQRTLHQPFIGHVKAGTWQNTIPKRARADIIQVMVFPNVISLHYCVSMRNGNFQAINLRI